MDGGPPIVKSKSKNVTALLAIFLGSFGAHRFYLGQTKLGLLYLAFFWTLIPGIVGVLEGIWYLLMSEQDFQWKYRSTSEGRKQRQAKPIKTPQPTRPSNRSDEVVGRVTVTFGRAGSRPRLTDEEKYEQSQEAWIPPGQSVSVGGKMIPGGMVYVGSELAGIHDYVGTDAALIDPTLKVNGRRLDISGSRMSYWPAYTDIGPGCRATYLEWLSTGRRDPQFAIGYVFLFFYGLERRVFFDSRFSKKVQQEIPHIINEVEQLLEVYGENHSFQGYARNFLDAARARFDPAALETSQPAPSHPTWELPLNLKIQVARRMVKGDPIEPSLALAWFKHAPNKSLRTPARRCAEEFKKLFTILYQQKYGDGMTVKPNKTPLTVTYRPASRSLPPPERIQVGDLPDISALSAPVRELQNIADECCNRLDSYSRHVGKTKDRNSLQALALLPSKLLEDRQTDSLTSFIETLDEHLTGEDLAVIELDALLEDWPIQDGEKVRKRHLRSLAELLDSLGFGMEPDVRFGAPRRGWGDEVVLFRNPPGETTQEPEVLDGIRLLQKLAIHVALADGEVSPEEIDHLSSHLEAALEMSEGEAARLRAHREWLARDSPTLHGVRQRAENLKESQRERVARFLTTLACADGTVDSSEVEVLTKIYPMLGLDGGLVHTHLHRLQVPQSVHQDEPVTIREREPGPKGYSIPAPPDTVEDGVSPGVKLDMEKINATLQETEEVSRFLAEIFSEEDESYEPPPSDGAVPQPDPTDELNGLGSNHTELLRKLASRPRWDRAELEELADELGLFPDAALDMINDYAFEQVGAPVIEGFDELEVDQQLCREVIE